MDWNFSKIMHYYRPQRCWGKVIFSQACVILFKGGLPQCMLGYHTPREQAPPRADTPPWEQAPTPWEQTPPRADTLPGADTHLRREQSMLGDMANAWAVRILLECNLVFLKFQYPEVSNSCKTLTAGSIIVFCQKALETTLFVPWKVL